MITQFDNLLKNPKKPPALITNNRKIEGIELKRPVDQSYHSSVMMSDRNSSIRNVINTTYFNSENSFSRNSSMHSLGSSRALPNIFATQTKVSDKKGIKSNIIHHDHDQSIKTIISTQKQSPTKHKPKHPTETQKQITIQQLLKKYIDTNFIQTLLAFLNKQWAEQQQILLKDKRFEALKNVIIQKTNQINGLVQDFMIGEYDRYSQKERKLAISFLFKLKNQVLKEYQNLFVQILKKIPEDKIVKQETEIEELYAKLLEIYDPKYISSSQKMKERVQLFMEGYTLSKNNLIASVVTKLKPYVDFINQMEKYLFVYQKELIRVRNQLQAVQVQKNKVNSLLKKKVNFTPIQIDFERLKQIKDESKKQFFEDLQGNFINFHQQQHKKNDKLIRVQEDQNLILKNQLEVERENIQNLKLQLETIKNSVPKTTEIGTQVYLLTQRKTIQGSSMSSTILVNFLQNVSTPFTFSQKITASLINLLSIDKILYDYEIIRHKGQLQSFGDFMISWFLVRTGSKKIAQIFTKNFMYSVKEMKNRHKRFNIFAKICGFNGFRKKNIQEDLQYIFFQTQKAWYYLLKLALMYRKKLNQNPTGFHLLPPLPCESIFKIPLRKIYEIVQQFLSAQGYQIPADLNTQIDYYAINQISKFKSHDEDFQKQQLQQIHILREINFDIISGFILEFIARQKCTILEKLLRAITMKQKQVGDVLGYFQFEGIYRKFYKERRAKIESVYAKMCVVNQHDMMDIENAQPIIRAILQDQSGMRGIFDEIQSLKSLVLTQKAALKTQKTFVSINSFENFRERYYFQFYDFYNTTFFLEDIFKTIKILIKKKLKKLIKNEQQIDKLIQQKQPLKLNQEQNKQKQKQENSSQQDEYSDEQENKPKKQVVQKEKPSTEKDLAKKKNQIESKIEEWNKIIVRIPHFGQKILTIDQIIVHNMRRKEMIEASQFAWRTLRDILVMISKQ